MCNILNLTRLVDGNKTETELDTITTIGSCSIGCHWSSTKALQDTTQAKCFMLHSDFKGRYFLKMLCAPEH